ncbi:MAG: aspartate 1-decarboxylase [Caldilineales bacterium]|nr:aspartate 1-decarboxylase [Caldilineales bacterium]MDW8318015.1 aspartate 1-decarboxylase [Anaerolineae bacterium]
MLRNVLIAKIHRATVTAADLHYVGSITLDPELMELAGILPWERVQVVDIDNGNRLETYVIPGRRGAREVQLNGAAARLVAPGDKVIVMAYAWADMADLANHRPVVLLMGEGNQVRKVYRPDPAILHAEDQEG